MTVDHFITMEIQNYHQPYISTAHTFHCSHVFSPIFLQTTHSHGRIHTVQSNINTIQ